jgi:hypothetical protein
MMLIFPLYTAMRVHISGFLMKFGTKQSHTTMCVFLVPSRLGEDLVRDYGLYVVAEGVVGKRVGDDGGREFLVK